MTMHRASRVPGGIAGLLRARWRNYFAVASGGAFPALLVRAGA
jgi:hypothetical protein